MKICTNHWTELKTAIDERGLSGFIAKNGEEAIKVLTASLSESKLDAFDPLIQANIAIWGNALEAFGQDILKPDAPCPLCALDNHAKECKDASCQNETGADWIRFAADEQLENARQMGLLGKPN
jgi:hypothetical protein